MYIRALATHQNAALEDASPEEQKQLQGKQKSAASAANGTPMTDATEHAVDLTNAKL